MTQKKLPPTILISEINFHNAWARAVRHVLRDGKRMVIGDLSEPKPIKDACVLFELTGNAIKQINSYKLHPQFPFRYINQYCDQFTYDFDHSKFVYTYFNRLTNREIDQLVALKLNLAEQIKDGISSNRNQGITWNIKKDYDNLSPPCLQRIWIRYLGNRDVEVHLTWRSRDLYTAWQVNIIAIIGMLNREVIRSNKCRITKIIDFSDSLHIYDSDKEAEQVKLLPVNPQK